MSFDDLKPATRALLEEHLTDRQLEVFRHRLNGHSFQRIGDALGIDEATVRGHFRRAQKKLLPHYDVFKEAA